MTRRTIALAARSFALLAVLLVFGCGNPPPAATPRRPVAAPPPSPPPEPVAASVTSAPEAGNVTLNPTLIVGGNDMSSDAIDTAQTNFYNVVNREIAVLRQCYAPALERNPSLAGHLSVEVVIQSDGSVYNMKTVSAELADPALVDCVLQALRTLPYVPPSGSLFSATARFDFSPE